MIDRHRPASLTLATFNVHLGVDGWGRPFDVVGECRGLGADVLILQESWAPVGGGPSTAALVADQLDYQVVAEVGLARGRLFSPLPTAAPRWGPLIGPLRKSFRLDGENRGLNAGPADREFVSGQWGLSLLSRVPVSNCTVIPLGQLRRDRARRVVISGTVALEGGELLVFGTHMSHIDRKSVV